MNKFIRELTRLVVDRDMPRELRFGITGWLVMYQGYQLDQSLSQRLIKKFQSCVEKRFVGHAFTNPFSGSTDIS